LQEAFAHLARFHQVQLASPNLTDLRVYLGLALL
jgi:hypothetical protein